jgi:hypothetical protein
MKQRLNKLNGVSGSHRARCGVVGDGVPAGIFRPWACRFACKG